MPPAEQQAVYANRRRVRGEYGKSLLRRRGEFQLVGADSAAPRLMKRRLLVVL